MLRRIFRFFSTRAPRVVGALVIAAGCAVSSAAAQETFQWSGAIQGGDVVTIRGVNGEIVATAATGGALTIEAVKTGRRSEPETVRVEVLEDAQGVLVCAVYPDAEGKDPNRCARGDDYEMNVDENDVRVDFQVRIPAGVGLDARTVNGDVEATGLTGRVKVMTVNGSIDVETRATASATTVNGSIDAALGSSAWDGPLSFKTVNGGITLSVPDGTAADVVMETLNGAIESDFPFTIQGRMGFPHRRLQGAIGGGGERLELETVNGSIRLLSSG